MMKRRIVHAVLCAAIAGLVGGCLSSPPTYFYTLSAEAPTTRMDSTGPAFRIAIGPMTIPQVIDRPQFVVRSGPNQVAVVEDHRWAESLKREIPRVLAENISRLLGTDEVWAYPQHRAGLVDYRLLIDLQRFESTQRKDVSLEVLWTIERILPGGSQTKNGRSYVQRPVDGDGYQAIASAYSRALALVSEEMATAIRAMVDQAP